MTPVKRINEFHAVAGAEDALARFLAKVISLVAVAPGCTFAQLHVDPTDPSRFLILEEWVDVASHQAAASRVPSDMYAEFQQLIAEPPRGRYYAQIV